jgi:hypothetical protein
MQPSRLRLFLQFLCFEILVILAAIFAFMTIRVLAQAIKQRFHMRDIRPQLAVEEPAMEPVPLPEINTPEKKSWGRRLVVSVAALLLASIIASTFLFSVHFFSGTLAQSTNADAQALAARHPQQRPDFERGVIYPQWYAGGYGVNDPIWQTNIDAMKKQTGAQWIEIPVLFSQASSISTTVEVSASTPGLDGFVQGVQKAHSLGYRVFFVPLMGVREPGGWSGSIHFSTQQQEQAWFNSYWNTLQSYVSAAAQNNVEQMAIGTELQTLQQTVPDALWNQLISRIRSVFKNTLTYDMNWSSLDNPIPNWFSNPALTYIGVSTYIPLLDSPARINPKDMPALWRIKIKDRLDSLAQRLHKHVLITEIGYRNSSDALYRTWEATSKAQADPAEQAGAYDAALTNVFHDPLIAGTFFWGWDDVGMFAIKGQPAAQVLLKWYSL